ncbi:MAG: hypothetical protein WC782_10390 [Methylococcaceae bacterium]|jgi:hypothetical protein
MLLKVQADKIVEFADSIQRCIDEEAWENLAIILAARQQYLEIMFANPMQAQQREEALVLAETILQQDKSFESVVAAHRDDIRNQQLLLVQGKKAMHAYHTEMGS